MPGEFAGRTNPVTAFPQSLWGGGGEDKSVRVQKINAPVRQRTCGERSPLPRGDAGSSEVSAQAGAGSGQETANTLAPFQPMCRTNGSDGCSLLIIGKTANGSLPAVLLSSLSDFSPPKPPRRSHEASTQSPPGTCLPACPGGREENITPALLAVLGLNAITRNAGLPQDSLSLACG